MKLALKDSTIYNSISLRLGTALVAQDMVSQFQSLQLSEDHWMTEARRLFATSLAFAQIKAWSIGSGEDFVHEKDYGWKDQTPDEALESGGLCGLLKFNSTGYTDIDLLAFILLLVLPWPLTALLSTKWTTVCSWWANISSWFSGRGSDHQTNPDENPESNTTVVATKPDAEMSNGGSTEDTTERASGSSDGERSGTRNNTEQDSTDGQNSADGQTVVETNSAPGVEIAKPQKDTGAHDERLLVEMIGPLIRFLFRS